MCVACVNEKQWREAQLYLSAVRRNERKSAVFMSDNTKNHQKGDKGRTLPCPGKTDLDNVKDT